MAPASSARGVRRSQLALALTLALAGTSAAVAADFKVVDGIIQFPNVVVIDAPQAAGAVAGPQGGMKAYKDSAGSPLRGPSPEEMQTAAKPSTSAVRRAATSDASTSADQPAFASAGGGVGVKLDESSLQYSVVVRQPDGSLDETCVTGAAAANELVQKHAVVSTNARKEISNVR